MIATPDCGLTQMPLEAQPVASPVSIDLIDAADRAMLRRAIREDWPVKPETVAMATEQIGQLVGMELSVADRVSVTRTVGAMLEANQRERIDMRHDTRQLVIAEARIKQQERQREDGEGASTNITQINITQHLSQMTAPQREQWAEAAKLLEEPTLP